MRILFYDTETTGLPEKGAFNYDKWPHIVQLSFLVYEYTEQQEATGVPLQILQPIAAGDYIIAPHGYQIPQEASDIHGISHNRAVIHGSAARSALEDFLYHIGKVDTIVAHNANFDKNTIHGVLHRLGMLNNQTQWQTKPGVYEVCTMLETTAFCGMPFVNKENVPYPGDSRIKWPRLSELYNVLFPEDPLPLGLHNSLIDVRSTARCYFHLVGRGIMHLRKPIV